MAKPETIGIDDYDSKLLVFSVYGSDVLPDCPDFPVTLERDGVDRLKGVANDGTGIAAEEEQ